MSLLDGNGPWIVLQDMANARLDAFFVLGDLCTKHPEIDMASINAPVEYEFLKNKLPKILHNSKYSRSSIGQVVSNFIINSSNFTVYIDEAWSGNNTLINRNDGVIAGIVCEGIDFTNHSNLLTKISTHSYTNLEGFKKNLNAVLNSSKIYPFIFSITVDDPNEPAARYYDKLLESAIRLLLGWVLPKSSIPARISIIAERITGHPPGHDQTDLYRGLLDDERFRRWTIEQVRWEEKDYGYLPYADALAHLSLEHTDQNRRIGLEFGYKNLPGYVPFSLALVPLLEQVELLEKLGNVGDALDLLTFTRGTHFGRHLRRDLVFRIQQSESLKMKLLQEMERRYQSKTRDLGILRNLFKFLKECIQTLPEDASVQMQTLWVLLNLQDANHDGNPDRIQEALDEYFSIRDLALDCDRELTAYTDLNLAVHFADRLEFEEAEEIIRAWVDDQLFDALSAKQRGRMNSSLGQYRSMQDDHVQADVFFQKAIACFDSPALTAKEREEELDQTGVYWAINALDGNFSNAVSNVEDVLGDLVQAVDRLAGAVDPATFYHHHLLVRTLYMRPKECGQAIGAYLERTSRWADSVFQHPWPLIHLYRGLLLWRAGQPPEATAKCFDTALAVCDSKHHGGTIRLIGAMISAVAACTHSDKKFSKRALEYLNGLDAQLPAAVTIMTSLREILAHPAPDKINATLSLLPFNYH